MESTKNSSRGVLVVIIVLYFLLGFIYSSINPILESPDELLNYQNIQTILTNGALPVLQPGEFSKAHHPPLYYLIGAILTNQIPANHLAQLAANTNEFWGYRLYEPGNDNKSQYLYDPALAGWPYQDVSLAIHLIRWVSLFMGAGVIIAAWGTARLLLADEPALWWGTAALIAFNPMFLYIQGSVHNDALTNMLAAFTIFTVTRYWQKGPSIGRVALIAVVAGLGILTKITFLFLGPMVILALVLRSWQGRDNNSGWWRELFKMLIVSGGIVLVVAGWWFVRNQMLYGEPTSMQLQATIWQPRDNAPDWVAAIGELDYLHNSFWGAFGFGQITMPRFVYATMTIVDLLAVAGLVLWGIRTRRQKIYRVPVLLLMVLFVAPMAAFGATFYRMTISSSANFGRYLFTAYGVIAPLLVLGLSEWFPRTVRHRVVAGLTAVLLLLSVYALWGVLWPAYAPPPRYNDKTEFIITHPVLVEYPGLATLLGYDLEPETAVPGETMTVTLYWQVTGQTDENYPIFVQLVDNNGERFAGRDTHTGLGRYPTSRWQTGEIIADSIPLSIPTTNSGPTGVMLNIGFSQGNGRLLSTSNAQTTVTLGMVRLGVIAAPIDTPPLYQLGDVVTLVEIVAPTTTAVPGAVLPFELTWHTQQQPTHDYSIFVHLLDVDSQLVGTYDQPPQAGAYPTSLWLPGDIVHDKRQIQLPPDITHGSYTVVAGWYQLNDFTRLPVVDATGHTVADGAIPLFTVEVKE